MNVTCGNSEVAITTFHLSNLILKNSSLVKTFKNILNCRSKLNPEVSHEIIQILKLVHEFISISIGMGNIPKIKHIRNSS